MRSTLMANTPRSAIGTAFPHSLLCRLRPGPTQTEVYEAGTYDTYNAREKQSAPDVV